PTDCGTCTACAGDACAGTLPAALQLATMYMPTPFRSDDRALAMALMREHPLATLISNDDDGLPFVTHLPLHLEERGDELVLLGHCARPNPHWKFLQSRPRALISF